MGPCFYKNHVYGGVGHFCRLLCTIDYRILSLARGSNNNNNSSEATAKCETGHSPHYYRSSIVSSRQGCTGSLFFLSDV